MSLNLFLACQSRDLASVLAGDWRDFVASGFSEVPIFVRPTSLRFDAEQLCLLCCSATPHLVLPCGHVAMCAECLERYLRTPRGRECPLCRQSVFSQLSLSRAFLGFLLSFFHQLLMTLSFATRNSLLIKALVHRNAHAIDLESCLIQFEAVSMDAV